MANSKISALTGATTPLAGTEVLPIVQSGVTKQVSVADLTAGRVISASGGTFKTTGAYGTVSVDNTGTTGGGGFAVRQNGTTMGAVSVSGYIRGDTSTNLALFSETGKSIEIFVNGSATAVGSFSTAGNYTPAAAKGVNFTGNTPAAGMTSQLLNWYEEGTWTPTSFDISYSSASGSYTRIGSQVFVYFNIVLPATADANNITIVGFPFTVANLDQMRAGSIGYTNYGTACTPTAVKNTTRGNILTFAGTAITNVAASTKTFSGVFIYRV